MPCLSSAELCCGRCKTIAPENQAADELYSTDHHNIADGITALPKDYTDVPRQASRSLVRHSLETLAGRSLLLRASRRRSALRLLIRNSSAATRKSKQPA